MRWLRVRDNDLDMEIRINLRDDVDAVDAVRAVYEAFEKISPCLVHRCFSFVVEESFNPKIKEV